MPALIITKEDGSTYTEYLTLSETRVGSAKANQCCIVSPYLAPYWFKKDRAFSI